MELPPEVVGRGGEEGKPRELGGGELIIALHNLAYSVGSTALRPLDSNSRDDFDGVASPNDSMSYSSIFAAVRVNSAFGFGGTPLISALISDPPFGEASDAICPVRKLEISDCLTLPKSSSKSWRN